MTFDRRQALRAVAAPIACVTPSRVSRSKALLRSSREQVAVLEDDLEQLYDDQFIETCAEWVVPYIGDLVGYRRCTA